MTRALSLAVLISAVFSTLGLAQSDRASKQKQQQPAQQSAPNSQASRQPSEEGNPPEEDESVAPEKFTLDPLESDRNIKVGNFYMHKGTPSGYRAALARYQRATRFNPASAEAFFKVGEAQEKLKHTDAAKAAFKQTLQLAPPDSKLAREAKKKLAGKG